MFAKFRTRRIIQTWFRKLFWNQCCDAVQNLPWTVAFSNFYVFHSTLVTIDNIVTKSKLWNLTLSFPSHFCQRIRQGAVSLCLPSRTNRSLCQTNCSLCRTNRSLCWRCWIVFVIITRSMFMRPVLLHTCFRDSDGLSWVFPSCCLCLMVDIIPVWSKYQSKMPMHEIYIQNNNWYICPVSTWNFWLHPGGKGLSSLKRSIKHLILSQLANYIDLYVLTMMI